MSRPLQQRPLRPQARTGPPPPARHAEEVALPDGAEAPRMSSTTGRQLRPMKDVDSEEPPVDSSASYSTGGHQRQIRQAAANDYSCLDNFGFRVSTLEKAAEERYEAENSPSARTLRKWELMAANWNVVDYSTKKKYCRKGVPQHLRCKVWQLLLGTYGASARPERQGLYVELKRKPLDAEIADVIERDLSRTFPTHHLFESSGTRMGQKALRNILRAYAHYNSLVGYCQGMGFLAATLLLQIEDEENTFWAFCSLMEKPPHQYEGLYEPGFPQLRCCFYVLENLFLETKAKKIGRRLKEASIEPSFYATHWFLTSFSYELNFSLVSRIWDMFLCEGWKPIYRVAIALLLLQERTLLAQRDETELMMALKQAHETVDPQQLLPKALRVKFKTARVIKFTRDFRLK